MHLLTLIDTYTFGRTPLEEGSARPGIFKRENHPVTLAGFELAISGTERPQTYVLEQAATEIGCQKLDVMKRSVGKTNQDWRSCVRLMKFARQVTQTLVLTELVI